MRAADALRWTPAGCGADEAQLTIASPQYHDTHSCTQSFTSYKPREPR